MAEARLGADVKAVFGVCAALSILASALESGPLGYLVSPIVLAGLIFCAARAPLRHSLLTLTFCAFTIDYQTESYAGGMFKTPLYGLGTVLFEHLNIATGIKPLFMSGMDIVLGVLGVVAYLRESSKAPIDRAGRVPTPKPLVTLAKIALGGAMYVWIGGLVRGGDFSMSLWQLQKVVYLPILFLLYHLALRGPKDHAALVKVLLVAATYRAAMAVFVKHTVKVEVDPNTGIAELATATTHADSMLFAAAFVLLVLMVVERVPNSRRLAVLLLPILFLGMSANHRRLVWVHVALVLITLYVAMPDNPFKRRFRRTAYASLPLVGLYMMIGWNKQYSTVFKPVKIARSIIEPKSDGSSLWRELENYNLIMTLRESPIIGYGYGHKYIEAVPLPAVEYSLEYYCPHNSLLGLWAFGGVVGYTAITLMWGGGVFFAMRAYHAAKEPAERVGAIVSVGAVLVYLVQAFGDIGLGSLTGIHILAPALALGGKLAVSTGAWGAARPVAQAAPPAVAPARAAAAAEAPSLPPPPDWRRG
jgi:hypothetical protein